MQQYNFNIESTQPVSALFLTKGIVDFAGAAGFIRKLPYRRNADKHDLTTLFSDGCGTCSTKNAVLKLLALENKQEAVRLMLGVFKMKAADTPRIRKTLAYYGLQYLPEAHNYLRINGSIADYTWDYMLDFSQDLLAEEEICPEQITGYKVAYHRKFLGEWLQREPDISYNLEELWNIREQCIRDLATI